MIRMQTRRWVGPLVAGALWIGPIGRAEALPWISEVYYDAVGSDNGVSFVEIFGPVGASLEGLVIEGVNGSDGAVSPKLTLGGVIPSDGFFVVADDAGGGVTTVLGADLVLNFDFQNGPDSIVLRAGELVLDAVGYGEFAPEEVFAGEGLPAPDGAAGTSVARVFANRDTGDNAVDFAVSEVPTPGSGPLAAVPEPGAAALLGLGLAGIGARGRRGCRG